MSFLRGGRWGKDSKLSRSACIGEVKKPDIPGAPKEPFLYWVAETPKLRCKWKLSAAVPPVSAVFVRVRSVGQNEWFYVPASGLPQAEECEPVRPPTSEIDIIGLHPGIRYEAQLVLRNKLGMGPPSIPSEASCIGRPMPRLMKCMYCFNDFDLQHAEYTKAPEQFWCPGCRFRNMDPFNAVAEPDGLLWCGLVNRPVLNFKQDLPDLKAWRKEEHTVQMRMVKLNSDNCAQVWPMTVGIEANGNEVFKIIPPEEGHVRRDVPRNIAGGVKPGANSFVVNVDDPTYAGFALALVHTYPRSVTEISSDIVRCEEEQARERVCSLLADNWSDEIGPHLADNGEDEEDEISCVISNKLKLRCPLSFERVVNPVRGESCVHLQCFGLGAYLESNVKMRALNNRWTCPVCTNILRPRDLRIDAYVEKVLADTPETVDEVVIFPGGDYKWVDEAEAPKPASSQTGRALVQAKNRQAAADAGEADVGDEPDGEGEAEGEIDNGTGAAEKRKVPSGPDGQPLADKRARREERLLTVDGADAGDEMIEQP